MNTELAQKLKLAVAQGMAAAAVRARRETLAGILMWARGRREAETANRPDENVNKRTLEVTWDQVIGKLEDAIRSTPEPGAPPKMVVPA